MNNIKPEIRKLPASPGVYFFYDRRNNIIYIGKAANIKNRVRSYFQKPLDNKTTKLVSNITRIDYTKTNSVIEALILEANLMKKFKPYYNFRLKDDKSFVNIYITKEEFPRVFTNHPTKIDFNAVPISKTFGPYTSSHAAREALVIIRKIFNFRDCPTPKFRSYCKKNRPCLYSTFRTCCAPCTNQINKSDYKKIIKKVILILEGKTFKLIQQLKREMVLTSTKQNYELAAFLRNQIFNLNHLKDVSLIKQEKIDLLDNLSVIPKRIEAFDISNISGKYAVGSMIVIENNEFIKDEYKRFRIKTVFSNNDPEMTKEILSRRFAHSDWKSPDLIIIDGGKIQMSKAEAVLRIIKIKPAIIAVNKGKNRRFPIKFYSHNLKNEWKLEELYRLARNANLEAHRFAINYHKLLRNKSFIKKINPHKAG